MVEVPAETLVTSPPSEDIVATPVALLFQVKLPPVVAFANCEVEPRQIAVDPVMAATVGSALTVKDAVTELVQLFELV